MWPTKLEVLQAFIKHTGKPLRGKRRTSYIININGIAWHVKKIENIRSNGNNRFITALRATNSELASRIVARYVGHEHLIPVKAYTLRTNKYLLLSPYLQHAQRDEDFDSYDEFFKSFPLEELANHCLFLTAIAADDQHTGNLINWKGHLWGLDQEQSFAASPKMPLKLLERMSPELQKSITLDPAFGRKLLNSQKEIQSVVERYILPPAKPEERPAIRLSIKKGAKIIKTALENGTLLDLTKAMQ